MTVVFVLTIMRILLLMPWEPMPESRNPWKGKWSGPRAGALLICTVPVSIASLSRIALSMSLVKTQPCKAYLLALQCATPSSALPTRTMGTTGPKGSSHARRMSLVTLSTSMGQIRLSSLRQAWSSVAPLASASRTRPSMKSAEDLLTTGTMLGESSGIPTLRASTCGTSLATRASATERSTSTTLTAVHRWPEYENPPLTMCLAARSRSASSQITQASLPPSSICSGTMAAFLAMLRPVSPPVKLMHDTLGCCVR
mmetsp:Transcript_23266/g.65328  ORF Transcript_23266/g.65328 Transcript_23266/m.65328 type:complete len:256 (+) Transcript_23266:88-855(+)